LTAPAEGLNVVAGENITLTATASDVDGQVVKVAFYQEGIWLGESTTAPYSFTWVNPPAGSYQLKAIATDNKGAISVSNLIRVTVKPSSAPTYTVTFTVKDEAEGGVPNASVTFKGQTLTSDANGVVTFTNIAPGNSFDYAVSKTGFSLASGSLSVLSSDVTQDVRLTASSSPTYTVTFTVKDANNTPLLGASVAFNGQNVTTTANGQAIFNSVSLDNNLFYRISKDGFNPNTGVVSGTSSDLTKDIMLIANSSPTYTVTFTLKDANNAPVSGASVTFNGQILTSNANGVVTFTNVAPGTSLSYSISKDGFNPASGFLSAAASNVAQNLVLAPSTGGEPSPEPPLAAQLNPRNIFSPNGDGVNEIWEVVGIEQQPELRVLIFNLYGQQVFQAQPYTNSWDGAGLPEGIYYYQMQNPQGKPVKKGAITLVR
jgi:gliding motility-associated-like protein